MENKMPQTKENSLPFYWKNICRFFGKSTCRLQASGVYIVFIDSDDVIKPEYFEASRFTG
jgi:hypothetical protein